MFRILQSIHRFLAKSNHKLSLLNGFNLAILKYDESVKCFADSLIGVADYGTRFGHLGELTTVSIQIPTTFACKHNRVRQIFFVAYRKTQFFLPIRRLASKNSTQFLQLYTHKTQTLPKYQTYEEYQREADNCCDTYNLRAENKPVLTATFVEKDSDEAIARSEEVVAKIRYSTQNVGFSCKNFIILTILAKTPDTWKSGSFLVASR
jgi:hypothetical protein